MRSSILRPSQAGRICAFCRQQQQQQRHQRITAARSLYTSSSTQPQHRSSSLAVTSQSPHLQPHHTTIATRRSFASSAQVRSTNSNQPDAESTTTTTTDSSAQGKPTAPITHYDFFPKTLPHGPPPHGPFTIDVRALRLEFLALQAAAHPDVHPEGPQRLRAQATSARINEAYRTLADPLSRAQHLLSLRAGFDVAEAEETAKVEDPALLTLVLETRERIEEAREEKDLAALREENEARVAACVARLAELFARDDVEGARAEVVRLRYWRNVRASIDEWEKGKPVVLQH